MVALDPRLAGSGLDAGAMPEQLGPERLAATDLSPYGCVILCNVERLSGEQVLALARYAEHGGGILVFPGGRVRPRAYGESMPFLPAELGQARPASAGAREAEYIRIADSSIDFAHPLFARFRTPGRSALSVPLFFTSFSVTKTTPEGKVLARFSDGAPALLERAVGKGRVVMATFPCDADWTNFPRRGAYLPCLREAGAYLAAPAVEAAQYARNEPVVFEAGVGEATRQLTVVSPSGGRKVLHAEIRGERVTAVFRKTDEPGFYRVETEGDFTNAPVFAVNVDPVESNLTLARTADVARVLGRVARFELVADPDSLAERLDSDRHGRALWGALLLAALVVFVAEGLLAGALGRLRARRAEAAPAITAGTGGPGAGVRG